MNVGNQKEAGQSCGSGAVFPTKCRLFLETFGPLKLLLIVFNSQRTTELCGGSDRAAGKHSLKARTNVEGCSVTGADGPCYTRSPKSSPCLRLSNTSVHPQELPVFESARAYRCHSHRALLLTAGCFWIVKFRQVFTMASYCFVKYE